MSRFFSATAATCGLEVAHVQTTNRYFKLKPAIFGGFKSSLSLSNVPTISSVKNNFTGKSLTWKHSSHIQSLAPLKRGRLQSLRIFNTKYAGTVTAGQEYGITLGDKGRLTWVDRNILTEREDLDLSTLIKQKFMGFHKLNSKELEDLKKYLKSSGGRATIHQAVCMRNYLTQDYTNRGQPLLMDYIKSDEHGYQSRLGDIQRISETLQVSPMSVLRSIAMWKFGLSDHNAARFAVAFITQLHAQGGKPSVGILRPFEKEGSENSTSQSGQRRQEGAAEEEGEMEGEMQFVIWMKTPVRSNRKKKQAFYVSENDWREFVWASQHDMQGSLKTETFEQADRAEEALAEELRKLKLPIWTEEDIRGQILKKTEKLRAKPKKDLSTREKTELDRLLHMSTPDLVLQSKVLIRNRQVRWMDIKDFYLPVSAGEPSRLRMQKLVKQAGRYNKDWGTGAFVFRHGYCDTLRDELKDIAEVLDGSFLVSDNDKD